MNDVLKNMLWFMMRGGEVRGPFPRAQITRYILLGRIRPEDEISVDRASWQPVADVTEVQPTGLENEESQVLALRRADERLAEDRRANQSAAQIAEFENRRAGDRRRDEPEFVVQHRVVKTRFLKETLTSRENVLRQVMFAVVVLVLVLVAMFLYTPAPPDGTLHCGDPAAAGVSWNNCHKEGINLAAMDLHAAHIKNADLSGAHLRGAKLGGSDLSYTNMSIADLSYSDLSRALLVGAGLRNADLSYANLSDADLSYADLRGANLGAADLSGVKLDNAIWIDGNECAAGSVGECKTVH
jgi:hypothetical protein